jgi:CHAD domain-containing protein
MRNKELNELILRLENYLECWKQFSHFMNLGREKRFNLDDETQFLEVKSIITQELEQILATIDNGPVTREDVHAIIAAAPSIRYLSETTETALRETENRWHRQFISLQSMLGQLKVKLKQDEQKPFWSALIPAKAHA